MQKLWCLSLKDFRTLSTQNKWDETVPDNIAIISINNGKDTLLEGECHLCKGDNVLNLDFDDAEPSTFGLDDSAESHNAKCDDIEFKIEFFTDKQAVEAIKFIEKHIDKDFFIHCSAGVSRSQAFVKYIKNVYFDIDWETNPGNPCLHANGFVYQKLMHTYRCRENNFDIFYR